MSMPEEKALGYVYATEALETLIEALKKKDKIIDLMTNYILKFRADTILPTDIEEIKQYFENKIDGNDINVGSIEERENKQHENRN